MMYLNNENMDSKVLHDDVDVTTIQLIIKKFLDERRRKMEFETISVFHESTVLYIDGRYK